MEKKSNKGIVIALCTVIIVLIGAITYLFVSGTVSFNVKENKEENKTEEKVEENKKEEDKDNDIVEEKSSKIKVLDFYPSSVAIVSDGFVYVNVYGSTLEIDRLFGDGAFQTLISTRKNYKTYSFDNLEYKLNDNSNFVGMKLNTSNVKNVYGYNYGHSLSNNYGLILLNEDKTLSMISLYSLVNGIVEVKSIPGLSNIESVVTEKTDAMYTYAVKENGEKVDLIEYMPNDYKQF